MFSSLLSGTSGSYNQSTLKILRNHQTAFQSGYTIFHSHQQRIRVTISPHACLLIGWSLLELLWWMWDSISLGFDLHFFIMTNDDEHLFMCLLVICIYSFMYIFNSKYCSILLRLWSTHLPILFFVSKTVLHI